MQARVVLPLITACANRAGISNVQISFPFRIPSCLIHNLCKFLDRYVPSFHIYLGMNFSESIRFIKIVVWTTKLIGNQSSSKYILHYTVTDSRLRIEFRLQPLHTSDSSNRMWFKNVQLRGALCVTWRGHFAQVIGEKSRFDLCRRHASGVYLAEHLMVHSVLLTRVAGEKKITNAIFPWLTRTTRPAIFYYW
jgi:hypothetical protein